ncbi:MAG: tRNA (adenosine(37)-N6)-threonylcarbamoyltransferase complex transferase subunit TsaD [Alphaproteobacteria bacterium]|nr:tRNA (adenosine(37)-N6)-threonylcarbamoyltransferase complex transferase subunit TsaD [Alphaproteobacteria bacterium]
MRVLGIETSCDETAVAIVEDNADGQRCLAHALSSQIEEHRAFGGVVPEIAARSHLDRLDGLVEQALKDADLAPGDLDGIAATAGPGLIGGVIVGVMTAKALSSVHDKPFIAVNHLEGHALTARFTDGVVYPYLLLLVSGGHCQVLEVKGVGQYRRLGTTLDDAAGECFDKAAKMIGLGFPGGPAVERAAQSGSADRFKLPRPLKGRAGCDFSFSGLKTAVRQTVDALPPGSLQAQDANDLAASLQQAIVVHIVDRCSNAFAMSETRPTAFVTAGGVAANTALRTALAKVAANQGIPFVVPPTELCTDNAVMIAWAGLERLGLGLTDPLGFKPKPRWPLDTANT